MSDGASVSQYALITGGTSGIGLETARGLAAAGFAGVGIVGRDPERLAAAAASLRSTASPVHTFRADFSSLQDVRRLAGEVRAAFPKLGVLVNNAGVWQGHRNLTADGYEETFAVNHLAHFLLTNELKEALVASGAGRVLNVSSSVHRRPRAINWDDLMFERGWRGFTVYAHSKLANVLFSNELARRWRDDGVTSNALNPGNVRSRITRNNAFLNLLHRSPLARILILTEEEGAKTSIHVATDPELRDVTGRYFDKCAEAKPNPASRDESACRRLWDISERLVEAALSPSK